MTRDHVAALIHGADQKLIGWLACDALAQAAEKMAPDDPERSIIRQAVLLTRDRLYDPLLSDPEKQLGLMRQLDIKTVGLSCGKNIGTQLTWAARVLTMGDNDLEVIELAAPFLDTGWLMSQVTWLNLVWSSCGERTIQLIHDGECPIQNPSIEPETDPIYLLTPGDIEKTDWIRVLIMLAVMWLMVAILKAVSVLAVI